MSRHNQTANQTIAFQGSHGAYSDMSCRAAYPNMTTLPCRNFEDAFAAVRDGRAALAMIPIDNTVAGRVADIHHLLPDSGLHIIGEHFQPVNHHLLGAKGAVLEDITHVYSHIHALNQCRKFNQTHDLTPVDHVDTAGAAKDIAEWEDKTRASISSKLAAEIYDLTILAKDLEDTEHNTTRFVVMSKESKVPAKTEGFVVTTFVFRVRNLPAALYKAMGGFATNGINMTKLESYLRGGFVAAQFYADVEGHPEDQAMKNAFEELSFFTHEVSILGTYPAHAYRIEQEISPSN
ncbi:MAG: prephenate dehydratase [Rhodospirillales bacterium]|jgi:prephenate dehydratase|tara:strand:+ start:4448 stop:5323 length:876 start_codon:yes stop_codon:yes gene_type:complete